MGWHNSVLAVKTDAFRTPMTRSQTRLSTAVLCLAAGLPWFVSGAIARAAAADTSPPALVSLDSAPALEGIALEGEGVELTVLDAGAVETVDTSSSAVTMVEGPVPEGGLAISTDAPLADADVDAEFASIVPDPSLAAPGPRDRWIAQAGGSCASDIGYTLNAIARSQGGNWGIQLETLDGERTFHNIASDRYYIPASNAKLFVSAAALQMYAPETKIQSSRLSSWVQTILRNSNNSYADRLFRIIGGQRAVQRALTPLGVPADGYRLADGSGLSRANAVKPSATVQLLRAMSRDRQAALFRDAMPVGGLSGTLRNRFKGSSAQGRVFAKTGTLRRVRALSGYIAHPLYGNLVFSILANHPSQHGSGLVSAIDRMVLAIVQMRPCDGTTPPDPLNLRPGFPPRLPSVFDEFRQRQEERQRRSRETLDR